MNDHPQTVSGNIVDVSAGRIYSGSVKIAAGSIVEIVEGNRRYPTYLVPGLVDAHIHIESSLLPPSEFARIAVVHGTVATVSDPHEIANVLGAEGVRYMIENAKTVPMKFYFGAPSCVPATPFETSGASLGPEEVEALLRLKEIRYLAEVMNFPGVLFKDPIVMKKLECARRLGKPIDGHAPGLTGADLRTYVKAGISTDHECLSREEALEKIEAGMKLQIREGSAAKSFDTFLPLAKAHSRSCMFCSDDKHPDDLIEGHINLLVKRALGHGIDIMQALAMAAVNPIAHYGLEVGLLRRGDPADFLEVDSLERFNVLRTFIDGRLVAERGRSLLPRHAPSPVNNFRATPKNVAEFRVSARGKNIHVIEAIDGQLITNRLVLPPTVHNGRAVADVSRDLLKMVVINRYQEEARPAIGFVKNFGLTRGAMASSIAHDSHNIIAVGAHDEDLCSAVNLVIEHQGGIAVVSGSEARFLPLPLAGIMSDEDYASVARDYVEIDRAAKSLGSTLSAPFMTLSFMALPVIPSLKLCDRGLFDGVKFEFIDLFAP
jgi:adenine deaminase